MTKFFTTVLLVSQMNYLISQTIDSTRLNRCFDQVNILVSRSQADWSKLERIYSIAGQVGSRLYREESVNAAYNNIEVQFKLEYANLLYQVYPSLNNFSEKAKDYFQTQDRTFVNSAGDNLRGLLYQSEAYTYNELEISPRTRKLISLLKDPYLTVLVERAVKEDLVKQDVNGEDTTYSFKEKIIKELSGHLNLLMKNKYPYYTYETKNKQIIKFVSIKTGNDLFSRTATNYDRDYTGSFLLEIGTDYFNPLRKRPVKSYQTLVYGFDVFTPSFRDTTKFKKFNSIDSLDRPHASFQYFGWSKKCLSKLGRLRWSTTIKFGKIGGSTGAIFQSTLHQDVSYSLRPRGWDAQIANGGRIAVSLETSHEYQFYAHEDIDHINGIKNFYISPFAEFKLGYYMTNGSFGLQISNKKFTQNNHNYINHRTKQGVDTRLDHFMYNVSFKATYVVHNTMLEGYGVTSTTEDFSDTLTPKSVYVLTDKQVRRLIYTANICFSYTTRFGTIFYSLYAFSPETYLTQLKTSNPYSTDLDLSKRWHQFAEIGLTFNIHK